VLFVLSLDRAAAAGDTQAAVQRTLVEREASLAKRRTSSVHCWPTSARTRAASG